MRLAAVLALAVALAGCGGGGRDERDELEDYILATNRTLETFRPDLERAQAALNEFSSGEPRPQTGQQLREAVSGMHRARLALYAVDPPPQARRLHRDLQHLLDLQAWLAQDLGLMSSYLPQASRVLRPAQAGGARLRSSLAEASRGREQIAALRRYAATAEEAVAAMDALVPPVVLDPFHEGELARLRASARLAVSLATAIERRNARAVDRALEAFERELPDPTAVSRAQAAAVRAFNRRIADQQRLAVAIARKHAALATG